MFGKCIKPVGWPLILAKCGIAVALLTALNGCGKDRPAGVIEGKGRSGFHVAEQMSKRYETGEILARRTDMSQPPQKQILFGDLHVHSTYSLDAFTIELPLMGLQGAHPPADACDFARYCANLDFFGLTDHAENITPEHWLAEKAIIRECNNRAGSDRNPDMVAYLGWEWTQVGKTAADHWGHKNVIFAAPANRIPRRPINSRPYGGSLGIFDSIRIATRARFVDPLNWQDYADLQWFLDRLDNLPECPRNTSVYDLPLDCFENAPTPDVLYDKLDQWGLDTLVIPHGNTWGLYTPPDSTWDKSLTPKMHNPKYQRLIEVMSGHGNSEENRGWRAFTVDENGQQQCAKPSKDYLPCCWQAGEIMRTHCGDISEAACEEKVVKARQYALEAGSSYIQTLPGSKPEQWLNCGQCEDCFKPSFGMVPTESVQYALAISHFSSPNMAPQRFKFGFIGSTDDHSSRPGTGYKQYDRRKMTFASGVRSPRFNAPLTSGEMGNWPQKHDPSKRIIPDTERMNSFVFPGGIMAVHATGRDRYSIWDAMERREVYGTSGPRILLWFELLNGPDGRKPMGVEQTMDINPKFEVRAAGALRQQPGCPIESKNALSPQRLEYLCAGECNHPSNARNLITAIEIIRIKPQIYKDEPVDKLIEDVWLRFECPPDPQGCTAQFEDPDFVKSGRDTVYYVRVLQEPTDAINGALIRTDFDESGQPIAIDPCFGDYRTDFDDDCLAPSQERAWSSPIFINQR